MCLVFFYAVRLLWFLYWNDYVRFLVEIITTSDANSQKHPTNRPFWLFCRRPPEGYRTVSEPTIFLPLLSHLTCREERTRKHWSPYLPWILQEAAAELQATLPWRPWQSCKFLQLQAANSSCRTLRAHQEQLKLKSRGGSESDRYSIEMNFLLSISFVVRFPSHKPSRTGDLTGQFAWLIKLTVQIIYSVSCVRTGV